LVVEPCVFNEHADLAAELDRVDLLDRGERRGEGLKVVEPLDIALELLAPRAGTRSR
jgi:hypothetical protein